MVWMRRKKMKVGLTDTFGTVSARLQILRVVYCGE